MVAHTAVSYDELAELVQAELERGYQPTRSGRRRLLDLVVELRDAAPLRPSGLLDGRSWRIASVSVAGIGGIGALAPPVLELTPTAGLTVVYAQNGHGKTSLARAMESALRAARHEAEDVTGDLWSAQLVSEGESYATIELILVSGADRLEVRVVFGPTGDEVTATLADADGRRRVELDRAWREALLGSRACYSYSVLQTRLKSDRDLQSYLEELLVLGPVWQAVRTALEGRAAEATTAKKAVEKASRETKAAEATLRKLFLADPRRPTAPPDVVWPSCWTDDVDRWLLDNAVAGGLDDSVTPVADDYERQVERLREALRESVEHLTVADARLDDPRHGAVLDHLEALVGAADLDDGRCPVCGTAVAWREHTRTLVEGARQQRTAAREVERALRNLADWVDHTLLPLVRAGGDGGPAAAAHTLRQAVLSGGCRPHSPARRAAEDLLAALADPAHLDWVAALRRRSDATAEWARERTQLLAPFAEAWRAHGPTADDADAWKVAQSTLDELQVTLRQERQDDVTAQLHAALRAMLPDADVEIEKIRHQGGAKQNRGAEVRLTLGGRPATLGMLSSGQRNALLLAPLLVIGDPGAFGFLLIDDPVHALDDLRVDHLAQELSRLADDHQVLVLTHDPRLEEHLRARRPDLATVTLQRDVATATVRWAQHSSPWETLLDDATKVRDTAQQDGWLVDAPRESIVAGLCRAALDGAIRQAAINRAIRHTIAVDAALDALDEQQDTARRFEHVRGLVGGGRALPVAQRCVDHFLPAWNAGTHGAPANDLDLGAHVRAARKACAELVGYRW